MLTWQGTGEFSLDRGPPRDDQTPAFNPTDPEPVPELDLDQTRGA